MTRSFSDSFNVAASESFASSFSRKRKVRDLEKRIEARNKTIKEESQALIQSGDYVQAGVSFDPDTGTPIPIIETREKAQQRQALTELKRREVKIRELGAITKLLESDPSSAKNFQNQLNDLRKLAANGQPKDLIAEIERRAQAGQIKNDPQTKDQVYRFATSFKGESLNTPLMGLFSDNQ